MIRTRLFPAVHRASLSDACGRVTVTRAGVKSQDHRRPGTDTVASRWGDGPIDWVRPFRGPHGGRRRDEPMKWWTVPRVTARRDGCSASRTIWRATEPRALNSARSGCPSPDPRRTDDLSNRSRLPGTMCRRHPKRATPTRTFRDRGPGPPTAKPSGHLSPGDVGI